MANIVVGMHNSLARLNGKYPYFEVFLEKLKEHGNNVLCFERTALETRLDSEIPDVFLEKIKKFNPDLFIFFNNQFWDISKYFEQPIIIYDVDSPNGFCNIDKLKRNQRYKYLTIQESDVQLIKEVLDCNQLEVEYIPPFSEVRANSSINQDVNIGFCGSHWIWNDFRQIINFLNQNPSESDRLIAKKAYKMLAENPFLSPDELYEKLGCRPSKKINFGDLFVFTTRISGIKRIRYLLAVEDLGLEIRAGYWRATNTPLIAFPELLLSNSNKIVNNFSTTEQFYNEVRIGFNTKHIQAQSGFSWRVADILASNACLVTEKADDLKKFGIKIMQFDSPSQAREICEKLLKNENMRNDLVSAAHEVINKNHRFVNILPIIEKAAETSLHSDSEGTLEVVLTDPHINKQNSQLISIPSFPQIDKTKLGRKNKIYYKLARHFYKKINLGV